MSLATEPIRFAPVYQKRVWGGRKLATEWGRELPDDGEPYGESWDVVDREEAQSVVVGGVYAGVTLGELWRERRAEVFGAGAPDVGRFPILVKILDARETLSVQVHPPAEVASELGGEVKNEFWWVVDADPGAEIIAGVRAGVGREEFEAAAGEGRVEEVLARKMAEVGSGLFLPSGKMHALGGGVAVIEIQDNSDTTYRIYDWGRKGLDGVPRELHLEAAMRSLRLEDPDLNGDLVGGTAGFRVDEWRLGEGERREFVGEGEMAVYVVAAGCVVCGGVKFGVCDSFVVPAARGEGDWGVVAEGGEAVMLMAQFRH